MNPHYLDLLEQVKREHEETHALSANSRTLIVDGLNTFVRSFSIDPSVNENGVHVGGITGFLKSVGYAIKTLAPTRVVIVFDGKGGSQRRRKIYPDYKGKRKMNHHLNRNIHIGTVEDEQQNMKMQLGRLVQYLDTLPVKVLVIDNVEADDVIAYIATHPLDNENNFYYIMSSDKDFYQLINENVNVWSPTKKKLYNMQAIFDEYQITANNFVIYRILDGDVSDNINGVKGIGLKTIHKKLPILSEQATVTVDTLLNFSIGKKEKVYENIVNSKQLLERNFQLMQLADVDISGDAKMKIVDAIRADIPQLNRWDFKTMVLEDYINGAFPNLEYWLKECFEALNTYGMNYGK